MPERIYDKIDIAVEYLNLASRLWLEGYALFSSAHLAGAAEEIMGQHCRILGLESQRDWWVNYGDRISETKLFPEITGKRLAKEVYEPKNSIKHMNPSESDSKISIDIKETASRLIRAAFMNFEALNLCDILGEDVFKVIEQTTIYIEINS